MIDIIVLFIIPVVLLIFCIVRKIIHTNNVAESNELDFKMLKIAKRPRVIRDNNHRLSDINKLMIPENENSFEIDIIDFIKGTLKKV